MGRQALTKHAQMHSRKQQFRVHTQPGQHHHPGIMQKPGIPAQQMQRTGTRASGVARAERAKTHSRSTRNTPRTTSQHRMGRRRRGSDERRRTLLIARELRSRRELRCRYLLLVRSLGVASG